MNSKDYKQKNRIRRILGWVVIYIAIFIVFLLVVYNQSKGVNTLQFPTGTIGITTSKLKYTVGDKVTYTIKNNLINSITIMDHCPNLPLHVYQWTNYQWNNINLSTKSVNCTSNKNIIIGSNQSKTFNFDNWPSLFNKPGIYRIVAYADNYPALPYADFEIVDKPTSLTPQIIYKPVYTPVYTPIYVPTPKTSGSDGGGSGAGTDN